MNSTISNSSNGTLVASTRAKDMVLTYYSLALIIIGTLFNLFTFMIFFRPSFRDTKKRPTIHYMRVIAIFDILMLYGWNLDHYLMGAFGFALQYYSVPFCKFCSFLNYFAAQVSAWLRVFICLDRFLSLSYLHKTWFGHSENVLIIIACILITFGIIHFHFFPFVCFYKGNGAVDPQSPLYDVYPLWDYMNLVLYNCLPFILMVTFNSGVIYHLIRLKQTSTVQNSRIQHLSISITLVITTFLFLLMTIPATVLWAFFSQQVGYVVLHVFDSILYTYHVLSFLIYMITFNEFRREVIQLVTCNRVANEPSTSTAPLTRNAWIPGGRGDSN